MDFHLKVNKKKMESKIKKMLLTFVCSGGDSSGIIKTRANVSNCSTFDGPIKSFASITVNTSSIPSSVNVFLLQDKNKTKFTVGIEKYSISLHKWLKRSRRKKKYPSNGNFSLYNQTNERREKETKTIRLHWVDSIDFSLSSIYCLWHKVTVSVYIQRQIDWKLYVR